MSDLSSLLGSSSGASQTQTDLLVAAYRQTQQTRIDALTTKQRTLETRKNFFNSLYTKLNSLTSTLDTFEADDAEEKFVTRSITSSQSSVLTATANGDAVLGSNEVFVERLATSDILISGRKNLSDAFGESAGTQTFDLTVNGETKQISVQFTGTETNQEAMTKIVNAVNNTEDIKITASFIKDTSSTGRITLTAKETGAENKITFTDTSALGQLGITTAALNPSTTNRTVVGETSAGYKKANYNELDAKLQVNSINVTRASNSIDDLLPGVTLTLLKAQETGDQPATLTANVNTAGVESLIKPLLDKYNELLKYVKDNKDIQRNDSAVSSLYSSLRGISSEMVSGLTSGDPKYLSEIGIKVASDGSLSINDKEKLEGFLKTDPGKVSALFTSSDGFVNKINEVIQRYSSDNGIIESRRDSLTKQISDTIKRKGEVQDRIDRQADALRKQYEDILETYLQAQNQYSLLAGFSSGSTGTSTYY
jgi:flagellar hook-associated protein 2